jgi:two-component system sensor histidine kinase DesK
MRLRRALRELSGWISVDPVLVSREVEREISREVAHERKTTLEAVSALNDGSGGWEPRPPPRGAWLFAAIWLVYLLPALQTAWQLDSPERRLAGVITVLAFAGLYVRMFYRIRARGWPNGGVEFRASLLTFAVLVGLTLICCALIGQDGTACCVYLSVTAVLVFPPRLALIAVLTEIAVLEIACATIPGWRPNHGLSFSILVSALAIWGISQMVRRNQELARARAENAALAVTQERSRFARDIHDLLGHSLTVVTVKAELAGRLISIDPVRAAAEIADVERLARDALADVRSTVAGYRQVSLAAELVSARAALDAAGICAELPGALDDVPGERRELFGWAVREGVTNVIRHSGASTCRIRVSESAIEIVDDGRGTGPGLPGQAHRPGSGLLGLRERAAALGSTVLAEPVSDGGFRLRVGW